MFQTSKPLAPVAPIDVQVEDALRIHRAANTSLRYLQEETRHEVEHPVAVQELAQGERGPEEPVVDHGQHQLTHVSRAIRNGMRANIAIAVAPDAAVKVDLALEDDIVDAVVDGVLHDPLSKRRRMNARV